MPFWVRRAEEGGAAGAAGIRKGRSRRARSRASAGLAALALLVACGAGPEGGGGASPASTVAASASSASHPSSVPVSADPGAGNSTPAASPDSWTFTGADGVETVISDTSRIVVLNGDLNELVYALGFGGSVVGNDVSATHPPQTADLPKVGYQRTLNAERILSLAPTLVIGSEEAGPPAALEQVRGAGVPVVILPIETELAGAARKAARVGEVLGAGERGVRLAEWIGEEIAAARRSIPDGAPPPTAAFVYARGRDLLLLFGEGMPSQSLIEAAGGIDAGAAGGVVEYALLTAEGLAAADPDWLILTEGGLDSVGGVDGLLELPGVAQTAAGRNRQIMVFDDLLFLGLTPRVGAALQRLIDGLYGEAGG